jgi:uncharacterized peroxidase-related enzyme
MSFLSYSTGYQGIVDVFMRDPGRYLPFTQLLAEIMNGESELSRPQREMIALHVSKLNECHYCVGSHRAVLAAQDVNEATISAAETGAVAVGRMGPVLKFAARLTRNPGAVAQPDVDAVRDAGWSDQAIEDMINVVSLFGYLNRLVDGFGIGGSAEGFVQGGAMVAQHGYGPIVQMLQEKATA